MTINYIYNKAKEMNISFAGAVAMRQEYLVSILRGLNDEIRDFKLLLELLPKIGYKNFSGYNKIGKWVSPFEIEHYAISGDDKKVKELLLSGLAKISRINSNLGTELESLKLIDYNKEYSSDEVDIESLKDQVPIDSVAKYLRIEKQGVMWFSIYKKEKNPSMKLYTETNSFFCFATGQGGDAVKLIMDNEHINFKQAIEILKQVK